MVNIEIDALRRGSLPTDLLSCCPPPGRTDAAKDSSFRDHLRNAGQTPAETPPREAPAPRPRSTEAQSSRKPQSARPPRSTETDRSGAPPEESHAESTSGSEQDQPLTDDQATALNAAAPPGEVQEAERETEARPEEQEDPLPPAGAVQTVAVQLAGEAAPPESLAEGSLAAIELRDGPAAASIPKLPAPGPLPRGEGEPAAAPAAKLDVAQAAASVPEETNADQHGLTSGEANPTEVQNREGLAATDILDTNIKSAPVDRAIAEGEQATTQQDAATADLLSSAPTEPSQETDAPLTGIDRADRPGPTDQTTAAQAVRSRAEDSHAGATGGLNSVQRSNPPQAAPEPASTASDTTLQEPVQGSGIVADSAAPLGQSEESPQSSGTNQARSHVQGIRSDGEKSAARSDFTGTARQAGEAGPQDGLSEIDRVRLVQRVARAFHTLRDQGGQLRLRLSPPELGALRLDVAVREGVLTAHLEAETPAARAVLLDNLPALRDRLAEQQIRIERFDVDLMDRQPGNPSQQTKDGRDADGSRHRNLPGIKTPQDPRGGETVIHRTMIVGETQLNVVI